MKHKTKKKELITKISITAFIIVIILTLLLMILSNNNTKKTNTQIMNPATEYCHKLNYKSSDGYCIFPDGEKCNEWDFYRGKCKPEYTYCEKQGYKIKNVVEDKGTYKTEYAVCILPNKECPEELFIDNKC